MTTIEDPEDPRLDPIRDVSGRRRDASVIVEGAIAVDRALQGPTTVRAVFGTTRRLARLDLAGIPTVIELHAEVLRAALGFDFHRGVVAVVDRPAPRPPRVESIVEQPRWTIAVLERLADPTNVGAILRSAAALGIDLVVCDEAGADPFERRAIRASMGHGLLAPPWVVSVGAALAELARHGAAIWAATTDDARPLSGCPRSERTVLVLGNEGAGLSANALAVATERVMIPVQPDTDSLNVAAAAAVFFYSLSASR